MFRLIDEEKTHHSVSRMARLLGVSRQGYYKHAHRARQGPGPRERANTELAGRIRTHHERSRGTYGAPRIQADLRERDGISAGRNRITHLMRREGLIGVHRRTGRRGLTRHDRMATAPPDLIDRDFTATAPNQKWTADITYVPTDQGWLYLAVVMDLFSRRIVGWAMAGHMRAELVCDALAMAVAARRPRPGLIHHSDKGSQGGFNRSALRRGRNQPFHRTQRILLRQCSDRELLRLAGNRTPRPHHVRHPRRSRPGGVLLHRRVLQPVATPRGQRPDQPCRV